VWFFPVGFVNSRGLAFLSEGFLCGSCNLSIFLSNFRASSFVKIVQGFLIKFEVYGCFILNIKYWSQVLHQPMVTL
jgi:hypothetical protein